MSIPEKLTTIAENAERVFIAGQLVGEGHGYDLGYNAGYFGGKSDGFADGFEEGNNKGYDVGYDAGHEKGLADGFAEGKKAAEEECAAKHYSAVVYGDGTDTMQIKLPFEPDHLLITTNAPELRLITNIVAYFELDLSALGQLAGRAGGTSGTSGSGSYVNALFIPSTAAKYYKLENGGVTVSGVVVATSPGLCYFGEGVEYLVTASKYDLKPLKTRIEESVARLPAQTSKKPVYYQKAKVDAAFTTEEWNALIATKANYTFNLI